jgi:HEAT repeat protein
MSPLFALIESCQTLARQPGSDATNSLIALLAHPEWRVRYAAAIAVGDRRDEAALPALLALLDDEDAAPLFSQPEDFGSGPAGTNLPIDMRLPAGTTPATREAWRRRGRIKQAVSLALGQLGLADARVVERLSRHATDQAQDYAVRAAACKALGQLAAPASRPYLTQASSDEEWCTKTEAAKALRNLTAD